MIWLTWRQFRAQAWVALGALAVVAVILGVTGPGLAGMYDTSGLAGCAAHGDCGSLTSQFLDRLGGSGAADNVLYHLGPWVVFAAPSLIGMFWGAPLVTRELETGSFRMVWNQSITRTRWLAIKLGLIGLASMAVAGLLTLAVNWWISPIERAALQRMTPGAFGATGIVPIGYAAFAFAVGVAAGMLIRRTLPAMAVTLVLVAAAQAVMALWLRARLIAPLRITVPLTAALVSGNWNVRTATGQFTVYPSWPPIPGAWIVSAPSSILTPEHVATQACAAQLNSGVAPSACTAAIARLHLTEVMTYQPLSRYWALQWYETAIFLGLALVLTGFCFWRVRREVQK
jgi:hypothetical protein